MSYTEFLNSLKPGDKYLVAFNRGRGWHDVLASIEIVRRTEKQIIAWSETIGRFRFRASDGRKIGDSAFDRLPEAASNEDVNRIRHEDRIRRLMGMKFEDWAKLPHEDVMRILMGLDAAKTKIGGAA